MAEDSPSCSATADLKSQRLHEQPQSPVFPIPVQACNFQLLHEEGPQFSACERRTEHYTAFTQTQGVRFSKAEDDGMEMNCQAGRLNPDTSPHARPNSMASNIQLHLPIDSMSQPVPASNPGTGMPTARYFPGSSHLVVVDGVGVQPQWGTDHPSLLSCWYEQPRLRPSTTFQHSIWQSHRTCQHAPAGTLVQHPHFHSNCWYPAFPLLNINHQSPLVIPNTNAAMTSSERVAPRLWGVSSPVYPVPAHGPGPVPSPRVPLASCPTPHKLSALFSPPRETNGSSVSYSSGLQQSAESAFGYVKHESQEATNVHGQATRGSSFPVIPSPPIQPFFPQIVAREQQLGAPSTEADHWEGKSIHARHHCHVENDDSSLGQSKSSAVCTTATSDRSAVNCFQDCPENPSLFRSSVSAPSSMKCEGWIKGPVNCTMQTSLRQPEVYLGSSPHLVVLSPALNAYTANSPGLICSPVNEEYIWNSLQSGQHSRETKTSDPSKTTNDFSSLPSSGRETVAVASEGRTTPQRPCGKGHWGIADDRLLIKLVNTYGTRRWSLIATFMSNRLGKQCRERWVNHLQPNIKKEDWTHEEEQLLVRAHAAFGNKWSVIAKMLPGRTDNSIKNHWHAALRKKGRHGPFRPSLLRDYIQRQTGVTARGAKTQNAASLDLPSSVSDESVSQSAGDIGSQRHDLQTGSNLR
ncbi:protein MpR2R3-MYB15 [Marchantia polymorpha subsp. ruderalis]|uniref:Uncharacterized protein n=2 Tax=Marchantia polymorpha TaxID=3197 RepID=A0AAF6AZ03_MARPO|nr:hypothetical protein MARPO_0085s0092 [Marchantia polymorpha]BBN04987.1 hypothetical protein Mp_3g09350 [Marchantia polymorpha subsp. ruderalis]|eukprot:PTQ33890.1 hypothetical protein MARPO_0085s0092 [Marchantia polymorpha]